MTEQQHATIMNAVVAFAAMMLCCTVALSSLIVAVLYRINDDKGGMMLCWLVAGIAFSGMIYFIALVMLAQMCARKLHH